MLSMLRGAKKPAQGQGDGKGDPFDNNGGHDEQVGHDLPCVALFQHEGLLHEASQQCFFFSPQQHVLPPQLCRLWELWALWPCRDRK